MMRLVPTELRAGFRAARQGRPTGHTAADRIRPSILRYDYLALHSLSVDVHELISQLPAGRGGRALDLGSASSPYKPWLEEVGFSLETLDIDPDCGADHIGEATATGLPAATFDVVLCTQVLEHVPDPRAALREAVRILKPGGHLLASVPHVWFYHPHPGDYWRFTPEGVVQLCTDTGLEVLELRAQGGSVLTLFQVVNFLLYGLLGRAGALFYGLNNIIGGVADRIVPNSLFSHNYAWLGRAIGADPAKPDA